MAIGSGLGSSFGFATETTYGTAVAVTKFPLVESHELKPANTRVTGASIRAGGIGPRATHHVETAYGAEASVSLDVVTKGLGQLLQAITGGVSTSTLSGTLAYTQVHTLDSATLKSLTLQGGRPLRSGASVIPSTVAGAIVTSAEFNCDAKDILKAQVGFDGRKWDNTTALATPSYLSPTPAVFTGLQSTLKLGTRASEVVLDGARSCSWSLKRSIDSDDHSLDGTGLKRQPVATDVVELTGKVGRDFLDKTVVEDLALTTTPKSLLWTFAGSIIETTTKFSIAFDVPSVIFAPSSQNVSGPAALQADWEWQWFDDDSGSLPTITVITTDTAL